MNNLLEMFRFDGLVRSATESSQVTRNWMMRAKTAIKNEFSKEQMGRTGVYAIANTVNGKVYIGSTSSTFTRRLRGHLRELRGGVHHCKPLQAAWNKHGEDAFEFRIFQFTLPEEAVVAEQEWMNTSGIGDNSKCYNTATVAGSCLGVKRSDETKAKMSRSLTPEIRERISAANKGRNLGRKASPETLAKMSDAHKWRRLPKMSAAKKGKKFSEAHLLKFRQSHARSRLRRASRLLEILDNHFLIEGAGTVTDDQAKVLVPGSKPQKSG